MTIELKVPAVGESITDVQIGEWMVQPGEAVDADQIVVVIETDKVTVELPAPSAGTLSKVLKGSGEPATVGEVIGWLEPGEGPAVRGDTATSAPTAEQPAAAPTTVASAHVMPAAQRAAAEAGLDPQRVNGSGPGGRILKEDILRAAQASAAQPVSPSGHREEEVVAMTPIRQRIAERLVHAQQNAALLTTFNEIDMSPVIELRKEFKESFLKKHGVKLGFMSFFIKASVEALKEFPRLNAEMRGTNIHFRNYYDVGIAVGGGKGLVVPVLRNAEQMGFAQVERQIADFGQRAKANKLQLEELQGGTFTISNGGVYGSLLSTPIINPPQSGILGLHAIQERPIALNGVVVIRPMMYVALTYDHRMVDGREAVLFLRRIKECVERPSRILLEI